ncbi:uncharacterized protein ACRADG_007342 [Cochliomyia hominivorax]
MYLPPVPEVTTEVVKDVSRMYLPPVAKVKIEKDEIVTETAAVVPDVAENEIADNDLKLDSLEPFTKDAKQDPAFGFNGLPGGFPGPLPPQGFPGQGFSAGPFPGQGFPPQGLPGQGFLGPTQGFVNPGFNPQVFPGQGFPQPGFPGQVFPPEGLPGVGFPPQGFPGQGFPGQGFPGQRYPPPQNFQITQSFVYPSFQGQGYTNYPLYSSEQLKAEDKDDAKDEKLRLLVVKSDTEYDATNGGYLYNKPSVTF